MARRSLKPQLNQIRAWVRQGRTDPWIAHQLEVSASELREFRIQHGFSPDEEDTGSQEIDLRDEIEAEIEAAAAKEPEEDEENADEGADDPDTDSDSDSDSDAEADGDAEGDGERTEGAPRGEGARPRRRRRRGRRGGRGRQRKNELEATFDHGEKDGYGLWLDPAVKENPVYAQNWAGQREVTVRIEAEQIVIRRPGATEPDDDSDE